MYSANVKNNEVKENFLENILVLHEKIEFKLLILLYLLMFLIEYIVICLFVEH